jgi:hypothetical protein
MKVKVIGILLMAALGFSITSAKADTITIDVPVSTSSCTWQITRSGVTGAPGVGTIYWYNEQLQCSVGVVATKSWWTSTSGQNSCSISGSAPYKVTGTCNSFSVTESVVIENPDNRPSGAACTWSVSPFTGAATYPGRVEVYNTTSPCKDRYKQVFYDGLGKYVKTVYSR